MSRCGSIDNMRRRDFLSVLGAVGAWPLTAHAQPATPVVGYLSARSPEDTAHLVDAFRRGLKETGHVEKQTLAVEYRWAFGDYDRLPVLAAELVGRRVAVLVATGGEPAALAAKAATTTIPIVFAIGRDPIELGLAASYNRPGGNATGINLLTASMEAKRLGLLHELLPNAETFSVLINPNYRPSEKQRTDVEDGARALGLRVRVVRANTDAELDAVFDTIAKQPSPALMVAAGPFFDTRRDKLIALAANAGVPTMYHFREFADAGGLVSYGIDPSDAYRQVGIYTGRILNGTKPNELPLLNPTKFEFVINLRTATKLGVTVSLPLLNRADEVIE
jgi:putative ABC transport system substrate-binding protein